MGWEIHSRRDDGYPDGVACRVWSTVSDGYITPPMSVEQVRHFYLQGELEICRRNWEHSARYREEHETFVDALTAAQDRFFEFWAEAVEGLVTRGQSHDYYGTGHADGLDAPWREER